MQAMCLSSTLFSGRLKWLSVASISSTLPRCRIFRRAAQAIGLCASVGDSSLAGLRHVATVRGRQSFCHLACGDHTGVVPE
ncbi:hypothetical protein CSUI_005533 [Cystoisospora suis]|uniref:Uncharacterized protein n=1 Tax=Cystoisospora suis TaxID=483139 RepID=A0A2C6KWR4_9APIC|nr:hypothetical protein CSUI_005533 [Cystoisospora suis]